MLLDGVCFHGIELSQIDEKSSNFFFFFLYTENHQLSLSLKTRTNYNCFT